MAMTFDSKGCRTAANDLINGGKELDRILNGELSPIIGDLKNTYQSETADQLYGLYENMKNKFPEMMAALTNCANYLENTVAPAYERVEAKASQKIG